MKNSLTLLALICSNLLFSQNKNHTCAKRDAFSNVHEKSNTLTIAQIAETEKYNVHFYALDIIMDNLSTDVEGTVEIHGTTNENLDSVLFELHSNHSITEIRLNSTPTPFSRNNSAIKVPVNLTSGQQFILAIDYGGTPPTNGSGMSNASSPSWGNRATWSLSESFAAYEWWPCKQSLTDKADSVSVKITVPSTCKAGSNGILENVVDLGNGTSRYEWFHRYPIDYYLISVAIAEYVEYNIYANPVGATSPVLIQNYIYNNPSTLSYFQNDIDETVDFMELLANLYGPYPFDKEKYGHCMAPLSGGMEHQTMTTQGFFEKGLTTHELGHQWWGDNVTCESWADIWVNEGFASYSEYLMLEYLYPNETNSHMLDIHNNVKSNPNGSVWVQDSLNESRIFSGRLTYDKGAAIVHTFRFIMNDDAAFFQALKNIQTDFKDGVANGIDIRDYFAAASGVSLDNAFNEWYYGEGFPTYSARWNVDGTDLLLKVTHSTSSSTPTFTNPIELKFSRAGAADTIIRMDINSNTSIATIPNMGNVTNLTAIDPNNWIINNNGSIIRDMTMTASLNENITELVNYTIFPNPTNGYFTIESSENDLKQIVILDTRGRVITKSDFQLIGNFDISNEKSGNYIIQITNENGEKRVKTIVKN